MRIVYVITRADEVGGAQVHVRDLATAVSGAGHEVTVLSGSPGVDEAAVGHYAVAYDLTSSRSACFS